MRAAAAEDRRPRRARSAPPDEARIRAGLLIVALAACSAHDAPAAPKPPDPRSLAAYLQSLATLDDQARTSAVAGWQLDEAQFRAIVAPAYQGLYADYAREFARAAPQLAAQLAGPGKIVARQHYAGDRNLTLAESRVRWALPTLYPSAVADLGAAPIDAVFVPDGDRWRSLAGLDAAALARVADLDPACASLTRRAGAPSRCTDVAWLVVDSALRADPPRFAHACALVASLCGTPAP